MKQVTIHEAKTHLSRLIQDVLRGEEVIIAKGSTPIVQLVALPGSAPQRVAGVYSHLSYSMASDFDEPLDDFKDYMP
jgi:antitoxin (DNA-binding transcriptional repressor) of toxin-antitoxin stability system